MDKFKTQLEEIKKAWDNIKKVNNPKLERKLDIIHDYILSLEYPKKFTDIQREYLRRLAQELGYKTTMEFTKWWESQKGHNQTNFI